ncbi:MAG: hypothetical protein EON58_15530 [Alphaproteobacteria bacterium]|nr:MAG: hypothetical protein EON58_15530 [Alphaproteobacteria bacterium]
MFLTDADYDRADWPLLQNGAVHLFWSQEVLAQTRSQLAEIGYEQSEIVFGSKVPGFQTQISKALKWEEQFGYGGWTGNLNALEDGMRYFPFGPSGRSCLVFLNFHQFASKSPQTAHQVLDIIECAARDHLLSGKLLLALVQTNDNHYECAPVGSRQVGLNPREWTNINRGL